MGALGDEAEGCDDGDCDEDLRPMRASKMVILWFGRSVRPWGELGGGGDGACLFGAVGGLGGAALGFGGGRRRGLQRIGGLKTRCSAIVRKIYSPDRETPVARAGSSVSAIHSHDSRRDDIANPRNMRIEHLVRLVSLVFISRYTFSSTALLAGSWLRVHVAVKAHS